MTLTSMEGGRLKCHSSILKVYYGGFPIEPIQLTKHELLILLELMYGALSVQDSVLDFLTRHF